MATIDGLAGSSMATESAIDGPPGPVVAGDHLWRDRLVLGCVSKRQDKVIWVVLSCVVRKYGGICTGKS